MYCFRVNKLRIAGWLWTISLLSLVVQAIVAAGWPSAYSWQFNLISDLGSTMCGIADEGTRAERFVCSPGHVWANATTAINGLLLVAGACFMWSAFSRRSARAGLVLLVLGGAAVVGVGLTPWDLAPDLHYLFAFVQAPLQWVGMILLAFGMPRRIVGRALPVVTLAAVAISVIGFMLFLAATANAGGAEVLGVGLTERIAFDTLTVWGVTAGVVLIFSASRAETQDLAPAHVRAESVSIAA